MRRANVYSLVLCLSCASSLWAQGTFTNLDFESATLTPIPGNPPLVYHDPALTGWSGFLGTNQPSGVAYDDFALGSANISIVDSSFPDFPNLVIEGNYTVLLQAGLAQIGPPTNVDASISQTGLVPLDTKSLTFLAQSYFAPFTVSLGGVNLDLTSSPVANRPYSLYQADVSAFGGQTAELTFTALGLFPQGENGWVFLDAIQFSSTPIPIPEPDALSLLVIGVVALAGWHRAARRSTRAS